MNIQGKDIKLPKHSPYKDRVHTDPIVALCSKFSGITGRGVSFLVDQEAHPGKIRLSFNYGQPDQENTEYLFKWQLKYIMEELIGYELSKPLLPDIAKKPTVFTPPEHRQSDKPLTYDVFKNIVYGCSKMKLYQFLMVISGEIHYRIMLPIDFRTRLEISQLIKRIGKYIYVYETYHGWNTRAVDNIRGLLCKQYSMMITALRREKEAGNNVIPKKYGVMV